MRKNSLDLSSETGSILSTKKEYELYGYPWFDLYDEKFADLRATKKLKGVKSIGEVEKQKDPSIKVKKVIKYKTPNEAQKK